MTDGASSRRALRVLLVANDGLSAGHVTRMSAIAGALARVAPTRGVAVRTVLATTSRAHRLLDASEAAIVQLPAPVAARRAGFSDVERRRLVTGTLEGLVRAFAPDVVAIDTFPLGPHRELDLDLGHARRVLVRRHVPEGTLANPMLADGLERVGFAILTGDPEPLESALPCPRVNVPPITLVSAPLTRAEARVRLGLPAEGDVLLVAAGGGGDPTALANATRIAEAIGRHRPDVTVALARGPLAPAAHGIDVAPLGSHLAAFDGAIAPAGYNTTHELALAGVPSALFAQERPFDDQAARATRFGATILGTFDDAAIAEALANLKPLRAIERGGADRTAEALLGWVGA